MNYISWQETTGLEYFVEYKITKQLLVFGKQGMKPTICFTCTQEEADDIVLSVCEILANRNRDRSLSVVQNVESILNMLIYIKDWMEKYKKTCSIIKKELEVEYE